MSVLLSLDVFVFFLRQHDTFLLFCIGDISLIFPRWLRDKGRKHLAFLEPERKKLTFPPSVSSSHHWFLRSPFREKVVVSSAMGQVYSLKWGLI